MSVLSYVLLTALLVVGSFLCGMVYKEKALRKTEPK